jgi:hypothetical protein
MRTLAVASVIVIFLAAQPASADTWVSYQIKGNSCTSITSQTIPQYDYYSRYDAYRSLPDREELRVPVYTQYGVHDGAYSGTTYSSDGIDVTCPIFLPRLRYTGANITVYGYNRSEYDKLSCTLEGTDAYGNRSITSKVELSPRVMELQSAKGPNISPTFSYDHAIGDDGNSFLSVTCHLPSKNATVSVFHGMVSHLTAMLLQLMY